MNSSHDKANYYKLYILRLKHYASAGFLLVKLHCHFMYRNKLYAPEKIVSCCCHPVGFVEPKRRQRRDDALASPGCRERQVVVAPLSPNARG